MRGHWFVARWVAVLVVGLLGVLALAPPVGAAAPISLVVTNALDNVNDASCTIGSCTLRQAVNASHANDPGASNYNTITFTNGLTGPITLTVANGGTLTLARDVTIDGTGATITVDGNHAVGVFAVNNGVTATINALTIQHGNAAGGNGGGIDNSGALTVTNSTFANNSASNGGCGGILTNGSSATVTNTLLAGNTASSGHGPDAFGTFASGGGNLIGIVDAMTSGFTQPTDQTGTPASPLNPLLGILGAYGSTNGTQTLPLLPGSPAIDKGDVHRHRQRGGGRRNRIPPDQYRAAGKYRGDARERDAEGGAAAAVHGDGNVRGREHGGPRESSRVDERRADRGERRCGGRGRVQGAGVAHLMATQGSVSGQTSVTASAPVLTGVQPAPAGRPGGANTGGIGGQAAPSPAPPGR